jgi:hypothetical protein
VISAQVIGCDALTHFDNIRRAIIGENLDKQMNVVWLNGKLQDFPALIQAFFLNQSTTIIGNFINQDGFSAFWRPDKVKVQQVDAVLISLIHVQAAIVDIHVLIILYNRQNVKRFVLKRHKKSKPAYIPGLKPHILRRVCNSVMRD